MEIFFFLVRERALEGKLKHVQVLSYKSFKESSGFLTKTSILLSVIDIMLFRAGLELYLDHLHFIYPQESIKNF